MFLFCFIKLLTVMWIEPWACACWCRLAVVMSSLVTKRVSSEPSDITVVWRFDRGAGEFHFYRLPLHGRSSRTFIHAAQTVITTEHSALPTDGCLFLQSTVQRNQRNAVFWCARSPVNRPIRTRHRYLGSCLLDFGIIFLIGLDVPLTTVQTLTQRPSYCPTWMIGKLEFCSSFQLVLAWRKHLSSKTHCIKPSFPHLYWWWIVSHATRYGVGSVDPWDTERQLPDSLSHHRTKLQMTLV